jgi:sialate O-acetylesterase
MVQFVLQIAPIFSDNMILQHGKPVPVWGSGEEDSIVCVSWDSSPSKEGGERKVSVSTRVRRGEWRLELPPLAAGLKGELVISDGRDEIRFHGVVTGDVWFAGGQSNMEMELINCHDGHTELAACANPNIRFYHVVKRAVVDEDYLREEAQAKWQICTPDTAAMLSAAAYFFARKINADLNIPIGIINCSWGGTSISAWMSKEQLLRTRAGQRFIDDYAAQVGGKTNSQYKAEMEGYNAVWREWDACIRARQEQEPGISWEILNEECGPCPWPQPAGNTSPYCPTNLHTARIRRIVPYALRGFLYYQGEEDEGRAADYHEMMYYLVEEWRNDWEDHKLPFLFVQLPGYASREDMEAGLACRNWCALQESQYLASLDIANTGMAVTVDCGEYDNIHPLDKQTVGFRLALQALKKVYGKDIAADGPVFSWAQVEDTRLRLHFDNAEGGLEFHGKPIGFEIAAAKGPYYPAQAEIDGASVIVSSSLVAEPCRIRYAWRKLSPTPLFAKNGLPAMPFRSHRNESADL